MSLIFTIKPPITFNQSQPTLTFKTESHQSLLPVSLPPQMSLTHIHKQSLAIIFLYQRPQIRLPALRPKMQQIDVQSSQDLNDSYSALAFHPNDLFKDDTLDPTPPPGEDSPTYQEISQTISAIRSRFPALSLRAIVARLHAKLGPHLSKAEKTIFARQCSYAARSFVQLGYGISRMRKQICMDNVSLEISDAREYERIINRVFLCAYRRLEDFISTKCAGDDYACKLVPLRGEGDLRSLLEVMRVARKEMGATDLHCFFKLLKVAYEDYPVSLSKKEACNLYKSMHRWVEYRKRKGEGRLPEEDEEEDLDCLEVEQQWAEGMTEALLELYIQNPASLTSICTALRTRFPQSSGLIDSRSIKSHLASVFKQAIRRAQQQMDYTPCLELGSRFKRLQRLDEPRIRAILCDAEAVSVRTTLCEFYLLKKFDLSTLICTILSINEFVNKRENEKIAMNLQKTMEVHSMVREEYEFAGKRNQVLVFKRNSKKGQKSTPL